MHPHPHILVIDDDDLFRMMLVVMLRRERPEVQFIEARNGQEGYALYHQRGADLIIADEVMPLMSGTTLIHRLRSEHSTTPVVLLTGRRAAQSDVAHDNYTVFADKPMRIVQLVGLMDRLLTGGTSSM